MRVDHVAQDFGRHDEDVGVVVDGGVAGEEADGFWAVCCYEVVVFLVAEGFDGGGVEAFGASGEGEADGEFADDGFAGAGGGADEDAVVVFDGLAGLVLEFVEGEFEVGGEFV